MRYETDRMRESDPVIPEATEETRRGDRHCIPENPEDELLLREIILAALGSEWRKVLTRDGETSGWQARLFAGRDWNGGGRLAGFLSTQVTPFDVARWLEGDEFPVAFWVEVGYANDEVRVYWDMPKNRLGHRQENYLPHLPVLAWTD